MNAEIQQALELHQKWLNKEEGGIRLRAPRMDFTGTDFTGYSLSKCDIRHSNLTDCIMPWDLKYATLTTCYGTNVDFSKSCLDQAALETSDISGFNFIGATWGGQILTKPPIHWGGEGSYWVLQTDIVARIGCKEFTIAEWNALTDDDRAGFDVGSNQDSNAWWEQNKETLIANAALYAA